MIDRPYFMENESWYRFDISEKRFVLTSKAPKEAKKSLEEFYKALEFEHGNDVERDRERR